MLKLILRSIIFAAVTVLWLHSAAAQVENQGALVTLRLGDRLEVTGELLSVRDTALVISKPVKKNGVFEELKVVKMRGIREVIIEGKSKTRKFMAWGFIIGTTVAVTAAIAEGDDPPCPESGILGNAISCSRSSVVEKAAYGVILLGPAGGLAGMLVGSVLPEGDKTVNPSVTEELMFLKSVARFPEREPESLMTIK